MVAARAICPARAVLRSNFCAFSTMEPATAMDTVQGRPPFGASTSSRSISPASPKHPSLLLFRFSRFSRRRASRSSPSDAIACRRRFERVPFPPLQTTLSPPWHLTQARRKRWTWRNETKKDERKWGVEEPRTSSTAIHGTRSRSPSGLASVRAWVGYAHGTSQSCVLHQAWSRQDRNRRL
eukprot:scaffold950_cov360-Pavlova_lutheri.AAC.10